MIKIALIALLASAAISQPIGEPIAQEKITHSKPEITDEYGPAEVISSDEAHRLVKQYMNEANQNNQHQKLNWQVSGSGASSGSGVASGADFSAATGGSNFYLARPGGYQWLGQNGLSKLSALAAPKTYTTSRTSYVSSAPVVNAGGAGSYEYSSPANTASSGSYEYVNLRSDSGAKTPSYSYSSAAPQYSNYGYEYNSAPAVSANVETAVDVAAPSAGSSYSYGSSSSGEYKSPIENVSSYSSNESPMSEIVQEKDLGLGASSVSAHIEQVKTPVTAESFSFGSKSSGSRAGTKY